MEQQQPDPTETKVREHFGDALLSVMRFRGELTLTVEASRIAEVCRLLRDDEQLQYNMLADLSATDWPDREKRFEINYHLLSIPMRRRVRVKVRVGEDEAVPTVTMVWATANWQEREVFDMFGVRFDGHPDLRRILMPPDWDGHPLRKDYPLGGEDVEFTHWRLGQDIEPAGVYGAEPREPPGVEEDDGG
ncbi:MAG: NADH-quinone oxidoreductase subunit C [Armatimonadota bacterium]